MSGGADVAERLGAWLSGALGVTVEVGAMARLKGGAIQENWLVDVTAGGTPRALVIRKDAAATIGESHSRAAEYAILKVAWQAGVAVPEPIAFCDDLSVLGGPFAVMAKVDGVALAPRIVRDMALGGNREALGERLGRELAKIHRIAPDDALLGILGPPPTHPVHEEVARMRLALDGIRAIRPALEWGLRWAEATAGETRRITFIHRDFRTGNYMVDGEGLTAILDWEFAGWGDPMSDLGWFCAACWRFGRQDLEAGGIASRAAFYAGYEAESGVIVDDEAVRFHEVMAHLRWAVIALQQGWRHGSGTEPSLELALTGRIATELELAIIRATAPAAWRHRHAA